MKIRSFTYVSQPNRVLDWKSSTFQIPTAPGTCILFVRPSPILAKPVLTPTTSHTISVAPDAAAAAAIAFAPLVGFLIFPCLYLVGNLNFLLTSRIRNSNLIRFSFSFCCKFILQYSRSHGTCSSVLLPFFSSCLIFIFSCSCNFPFISTSFLLSLHAI